MEGVKKRFLAPFPVPSPPVQEIMHQFGGTSFSDIILNWPDQNRMIFWALQGSLLTTEGPLQRLVMPEDTHNEDVVKRAVFCGFRHRVIDRTAESHWSHLHGKEVVRNLGCWLEIHR